MTDNSRTLTSFEALGDAGMMMAGRDSVMCCRMCRWSDDPSPSSRPPTHLVVTGRTLPGSATLTLLRTRPTDRATTHSTREIPALRRTRGASAYRDPGQHHHL